MDPRLAIAPRALLRGSVRITSLLWLAVILGGVCALLPLLRLWSDGRLTKLAVCAAVAVGVCAVAICTWTTPTSARPRPNAPLEALEEAYVGSATCKSCHPEEHSSWHSSFHRTMTQRASRETVVPQFERLELDWYGEQVVLEWRGDELWTRFVRGGGQPGRGRRL